MFHLDEKIAIVTEQNIVAMEVTHCSRRAV